MIGEVRVSETRSAFLQLHNPWVRFEIPSELKDYDYHRFIAELLAAFVLWANPGKNKWRSEEMGYGDSHWNSEPSGIGMVWVQDQYFTRSKMYLYDGNDTDTRGNPGLYKGVVFYDHREADCRYGNAVRIFLIADAFEQYLNENGVRFVRYNWRVDQNPEEVANTANIPVKKGLSAQDHGYLNGLNLLPVEERRIIYAEKRQEYGNDPVALQQIDVYDGESPYSAKIKQYSDALIANDNPTLIAELEAWFKTNYPDIRQ